MFLSNLLRLQKLSKKLEYSSALSLTVFKYSFNLSPSRSSTPPGCTWILLRNFSPKIITNLYNGNLLSQIFSSRYQCKEAMAARAEVLPKPDRTGIISGAVEPYRSRSLIYTWTNELYIFQNVLPTNFTNMGRQYKFLKLLLMWNHLKIFDHY